MPTFFTDKGGRGEFLDEDDPKNKIKNVSTNIKNIGIDNSSTKQERIDQENERAKEMAEFLGNPFIKAEMEQVRRGETPARFKKARGGFMGNVKHKTMFTVGEQNNKEFVSVKPNNDLNFFSNKKSKGKSNNIFDVGF